jgi:uncharacterized protein (TIGR02271 family)
MQDYSKDNYGTGYSQQIWDYTVLDREGDKVGTVNNLWPREQGEGYSFIGVSTGWFFGREHVVPADGLRIDHERREVSIPLSSARIKEAPDFNVHEEITDQERDEIYRHYGAGGDRRYGDTSATGYDTKGYATSTPEASHEAQGDRELPIREEKLNVSKREVRDGEVRLRRIVRTEQVNVPVELRREDVVVERVPANETTAREGKIGGDKDITIPISHEEPVVEKRTETTGAVRARKTKETHNETISDTVRKEDVDVDRSRAPRDQR